MKKIIITGGHLTPALAVIDELVKCGCWEINFIGHRYASDREKTPSMESQIIKERGFRFYPLTAGRFPRLLNRFTFISAVKFPVGFFQAFYYLFKIKPVAVLSFGGYLSVPVIFWSWVLKIPSLTHEQTTVKSLATTLNSYFARKIAVSWPEMLAEFDKKKVVFTGNPVRRDIFKINQKYWKILNFPQGKPVILVTGGNQGALAINEVIGNSLPSLLRKVNILHLTGHLEKKGDFEKLQDKRKHLPPRFRKSYHLKKYVSGEEMGTFMAKSDLVVSRGGANTLSELVAHGKPVLVIPYPWQYRDEQTKNALLLKKIGMAEILPQSNLKPETFQKMILKMLTNLAAYRLAAQKAKGLVKSDAAQRIINEIEKII